MSLQLQNSQNQFIQTSSILGFQEHVRHLGEPHLDVTLDSYEVLEGRKMTNLLIKRLKMPHTFALLIHFIPPP